MNLEAIAIKDLHDKEDHDEIGKSELGSDGDEDGTLSNNLGLHFPRQSETGK